MNLFTHPSCFTLQKVKCCVCFCKSFSMSLYMCKLIDKSHKSDVRNEGNKLFCLVWDVPNQCGQELIPVMGCLLPHRRICHHSHPFGDTWSPFLALFWLSRNVPSACQLCPLQFTSEISCGGYQGHQWNLSTLILQLQYSARTEYSHHCRELQILG